MTKQKLFRFTVHLAYGLHDVVAPLVLMMILLGALLTGCASVHATELVYSSRSLTVRLHEADCQVPRLADGIAARGGVAAAHAATVTQSGRELRACWALDVDNDVLILDETGRGGYIEMSDFKPVPTI